MVHVITLSDLKKHCVGMEYDHAIRDIADYAMLKRMSVNHIVESTGFAPVKIDYDVLYVRTDDKNIITEIFIDESF